METRLHVFGIRHHGPGSAASLEQALDAVNPELVLIEGPPEASDIARLAAAAGMQPPVAILTFPSAAPEQSRFFPFAEYSPEWRAMLWAARNDRPVQFIDAPQIVTPEDNEPVNDADPDEEDDTPTAQSDAGRDSIRHDPLSWLAHAAGHSDGEAWWNALIEQNVHAPGVFEAIAAAMTALREEHDSDSADEDARELRREAHMRLNIRKALTDSQGDIAVVCGAWHVPALRRKVALSADRAVVRGERKAKVEACWVPWTDTRLAAASGYGAGVISPGWYRHLWSQFTSDTDPTDAVASWQAGAARLLRKEGLPAATASVIEATRLATTLAAIRGLPVAGLAEMRDASRAALCHGEDIPLRVIEQQLVIGKAVGEVDENAPQPPLQADLQRWQKKLRLKPQALERDIALDLRSTAGMAKSTLLHRLLLIDVPWGQLVDASAGRGTFREIWRLEWNPELSVKLAEALIWGPTVAQAASAAALERAAGQDNCARLAELVRHCLLADLGDTAQACIARLQAVAVNAADIAGLMRALRPLVEVLRYGAARDIPVQSLQQLVVTLAAEVCANARYACHGLDESAAQALRDDMTAFDRAVTLVDDEHIALQWQSALGEIAADRQVAPLLGGFAQRSLYDRGVCDGPATATALSRALSPAQPVAEAGQWLEGFIGGAGEVMLVDDALFAAVDEWIGRQHEDDFREMLPLLRRAFSNFDASSRRRMLDRVRGGTQRAAAIAHDDPRAAAAFERAAPLLATILGLDENGE